MGPTFMDINDLIVCADLDLNAIIELCFHCLTEEYFQQYKLNGRREENIYGIFCLDFITLQIGLSEIVV